MIGIIEVVQESLRRSDWSNWVSTLAAVASAVAAWLAWLAARSSARTAEVANRIQLYHERRRVRDALIEFLGEIIRNGTPPEGPRIQRFAQGTDGVGELFGDAEQRFVDEVRKTATQLTLEVESLKLGQYGLGGRDVQEKCVKELWVKLAEQLDRAPQVFEAVLKVE